MDLADLTPKRSGYRLLPLNRSMRCMFASHMGFDDFRALLKGAVGAIKSLRHGGLVASSTHAAA